MDYNKSVSLVIQSASRAFGYNQMQVTRRSAIYNIYWCGQFVSYSAPNWGFKEFASVNKLHNQAYRYFLGVGHYTPIPVVHTDMGWRTPYQNQWISVFQLLCHFLKMENSQMNKYVFNWSRESARNKCHNWWWHVKKLLCDLDLVHLLDDHSNGRGARGTVDQKSFIPIYY